MSWVDEPDDNKNDKFPVDTLVRKLKETVGDIDSFCQDYHGQARKCCDGIRTCFATMEESFASVKLQAIGNQNMHKACRKLSTDLKATKSCTVSWISNCHNNVNAEHLVDPFHDVLAKLQKVLDVNCNDLPPERTTQRVRTTTTTTRKTSPTTTATSTSTQSSSPTTSSTTTTTTTTTKPTTVIVVTTTPSEEETTVSITTSEDSRQPLTQTSEKAVTDDIHTPELTSQSSTSDPGKPKHPTDNLTNPPTGMSDSTSEREKSAALSGLTSPSSSSPSSLDSTISTTPLSSSSANSSLLPRKHPDSGRDSTIIIVSSAVGGLLLLCAICLCMFMLYKRRQARNSDSGDSLDTAGKPSLFSWLFPSPKTTCSVNTDTEIYAEIDEAFMEAVYRYDKENPNVIKDRVNSNSQFNACYDSNFNDDAIIAARDTIASKTNSTETSIVAMEPLSPLALIRKDDDAITSFQIDQSKTQKLQDGENTGNNVVSSQKGFLTRRPGFTDIRSDSSGGDYVYIEAMPNEVFEDEPVYAVPSFEESEYDTVEYGRNPQRNICQAPEQNYNSFHVYRNVAHASFHSSVPSVEQNVKEYRRSSSDLEIDNHLYENPDTLMEY